MIKSQLIKKLGRVFDFLPEKDVALCSNVIIDSMANHLAKGGRIEIRDFGSFSLHYRSSRLAHNPKTGEKLMTEPKYAIHFKPGKGMKERINESRHHPIKDANENEE